MEAGWRADSFLSAIACTAKGEAVVVDGGGGAPLSRVLDDATHAPLLSDGERALVRDWIARGSKKRHAGAHPAGFVDPRSTERHGRLLRDARYRPMLDRDASGACARCHDGAPSGHEDGRRTADGATACTTCHAEPEGVLACTTCHGQPGRPFPPRDPCFFPDDAARGLAHAAHVRSDRVSGGGLACASCHPMPGAGVMGGSHGNLHVDVVFDPAAGASTFDAASKRCTSACHARPGGTRPTPAWTETGPMGCGDCHGAPPPNHYDGGCSNCHAGVHDTGTGFAGAHLHVNGKVNLGDGSGRCGACHGKGDDPWPETGAHSAHRLPTLARSVACETCHDVPSGVGAAFAHPHGGEARVQLKGLAGGRAGLASFSAGACSNVYCHGAGLMGTTPRAPVWADGSGAERACGSCHALPPGPPHIASTNCALATCHGAMVEMTPAGPTIADAHRTRHVNGVRDLGVP